MAPGCIVAGYDPVLRSALPGKGAWRMHFYDEGLPLRTLIKRGLGGVMVTNKPDLIGMTRGSPPPHHQHVSTLSPPPGVHEDRFNEPGPESGLPWQYDPHAGLLPFETLVTLLGDAQPDTRIAAAHALGKLGDTRAVESLFVASMDALPGVKTAARDALARIMHPRH